MCVCIRVCVSVKTILKSYAHCVCEYPWAYSVVFLNIAKKDIVFCWVPSHTDIRGNEKADSAAKSALDLPRAKVGVPYTDFKYLISQYIFSTWQEASFCQASPGRVAVLLQAVQEG